MNSFYATKLIQITITTPIVIYQLYVSVNNKSMFGHLSVQCRRFDADVSVQDTPLSDEIEHSEF